MSAKREQTQHTRTARKVGFGPHLQQNAITPGEQVEMCEPSEQARLTQQKLSAKNLVCEIYLVH
ncbi:hypothetical protein ROBYS_44930 [Roseobacter sp. OBYS 0001]|nr:hypothetical protein ROBYS_44930 [Roseobacter sp. OBYS 0001]